MPGKAVILLSGGLDSATLLAIARDKGYECCTLGIDYGQRHKAELAAAEKISRLCGASTHQVIRVDLATLGGSALTDASIQVPVGETCAGIPVTYVPARNTIMLSLALAWAEIIHSNDIFIGVNAVDYSGYPDCRPEYIAAFRHMAQLATKSAAEGSTIQIHAPLQYLSKAEIILRGIALGIDYSQTVSCYQADDSGRACGRCDSCRLRQAGFSAAGLPDPTRYQ